MARYRLRPDPALVRALVKEVLGERFSRERLHVSEDGTVYLLDCPEVGVASYFITNREFEDEYDFVQKIDVWARGLR